MHKAALLGMAVLITAVSNLYGHDNTAQMIPEVQSYVEESISQFDQIPEERKEDLKKIAAYAQKQIEEGKPVDLTFICTHNSRRSHMSQIWARVAAHYYNVPNVTTYSGGTEATAFNPRAVAAIERAGMNVEKTTNGSNPIYHVAYSTDSPPITNFSKVYNYAPNPDKNFAAIMTCSAADKACPSVAGCAMRVAIPYIDPKAHDNTDKESSAYDERCRQISREMLYAMSQVNQ